MKHDRPAIHPNTLAVALLLAACLLLQSPAFADVTGEAADARAKRPRIGLVLGGGGARGAAHIGVLQVLEELHVPVDCIAGTSMGALVGATFASGMPPAEIEKRIQAVNWSTTVGNRGRRDRTPIHRKLFGNTYTNNLEFGLRGGSLITPGGVIVTQDIEELLRSLVAGARYIDDFDALPIPFRAVATDMAAGELVILGQGDLTVAMRASMAVPGAFAPVVIGEQVLADGGQLRNLPVDIARDLCADVVIAVSLQAPPPRPEMLGSALALAGRSLEVMVAANTRAQLATLTDEDVQIIVDTGDIGSSSFARVPEAIPLGREAALGQAASLARYALPPERYAAWREEVTRNYTTPFEVAAVKVTGTKRVNPDYVRAQIRATRVGEAVAATQVAGDTTRIFSIGDFERVEYRIDDDPLFPTVDFHVVEKSWGPDFLRFDLGLGATSSGDASLGLRGEHRRSWLNDFGGEWHSKLQVGTTNLIETAFYQPLELRQRVFIEPLLRVERLRENLYEDGNRVAEYSFTEAFGQLDIGVNFGRRAQLRAGLRKAWPTAARENGDRRLPHVGTREETDFVLQGIYDTRDTAGLPTRGGLIIARIISSRDWLGGEESYDMGEALAMKVFPLRENTLQLIGAGGMRMGGELPLYRLFRLGGLYSFPGLDRQQLRGTSYWMASSRYQQKLADIQTLFGQALYGGFRLSSGRMHNRIDEIGSGTIYGAAAELSGSTPIGNFTLSLGTTNSSSWLLQFGLGRPLEESTILDAAF